MTNGIAIGVITDLHYAQREPEGRRHYRDALAKLRDSVETFNREGVAFCVELGDLIDEGATEQEELGYLQAAHVELARSKAPVHYVLGNHCVWTLTKPQFMECVGAIRSYYSFDCGGFHFVMLDGCCRADGVPYGGRNADWRDSEIPLEQREWLEADLQGSDLLAIVFVHQRLDVETEYAVHSAPEVRRILERSRKVRAVIQGHNHVSDYRFLNGIHYCTLLSAVEGEGLENNAYSILRLYPSGMVEVQGFGRQPSYVCLPTERSV